MTNRHKWPVQVATTGTVINEIEERLTIFAPGDMVKVHREQLKRWQDCVIYCAALLDPDNQPSTPEQLARMKLR